MALTSARIAGVNLPVDKKVYVSLSYLFGIGRVLGKKICADLNIDSEKRMRDLSDEELDKIRICIDKDYVVEGDLREQISRNIKMLISIGSYKGARHRLRLPVHGQRTKTNAKTRKGRSAPIANKKIATK
ncbi:MAG: 30S ribosomal protein S13 [Rickettsiales bacterium]|nr:30S ribosomal protein S13 [Rickettsiales bacterium]